MPPGRSFFMLRCWVLLSCVFFNRELCRAESLAHDCEFRSKLKTDSELPTATELTLTGCSLEDIGEFKSLETLKLHYFYQSLEFKTKFENLTALEIHTGHFQIGAMFSEMAPNLETITLEDVEISVIQSGAFAQFQGLRWFAVRHSNINRIEAGGIKLPMHKESEFSIVNSTVAHVIENGIHITAVGAVTLQDNLFKILDKNSVRVETNNLIVKGNTIEQASAHALDIRSPKIVVDGNRWVSSNAKVLASVQLISSEHPYFSIQNNIFSSKTEVEVDFRQLNTFGADILESPALSVSGNILPCTCNFPYNPDRSMVHVERSRAVYYEKLVKTSACNQQQNLTLHDFLLSGECATPPSPVPALPPIHQPLPGIDRVVSHDYYDHESDDDKPGQNLPHASDTPHDYDSAHDSEPRHDPDSTHEPNSHDDSDSDYALPRKPANRPHLPSNSDSRDDDKSTTTTASPPHENAAVIGPVIIVIIAIIVLVVILVAVFCCQKKFASYGEIKEGDRERERERDKENNAETAKLYHHVEQKRTETGENDIHL